MKQLLSSLINLEKSSWERKWLISCLKELPVFVDISRAKTFLRENGNPFNEANEKTHRYLVTIGVIMDFSEWTKEDRIYKTVYLKKVSSIDLKLESYVPAKKHV